VADVGNFYAPASTPILISLKSGQKLPFIRIGTPIATLLASTWFHANEGAAYAVLWSR
jgi:hypothetical protein